MLEGDKRNGRSKGGPRLETAGGEGSKAASALVAVRTVRNKAWTTSVSSSTIRSIGLSSGDRGLGSQHRFSFNISVMRSAASARLRGSRQGLRPLILFERDAQSVGGFGHRGPRRVWGRGTSPDRTLGGRQPWASMYDRDQTALGSVEEMRVQLQLTSR